VHFSFFSRNEILVGMFRETSAAHLSADGKYLIADYIYRQTRIQRAVVPWTVSQSEQAMQFKTQLNVPRIGYEIRRRLVLNCVVG